MLARLCRRRCHITGSGAGSWSAARSSIAGWPPTARDRARPAPLPNDSARRPLDIARGQEQYGRTYGYTGAAMATTIDRVKVTVNLPADLVKKAKIAAIERDVDLQDLIAEGLRRVLAKGGR